jgi:hypothetical protein
MTYEPGLGEDWFRDLWFVIYDFRLKNQNL